jgi:hypothetical protein
LAAVDVDVDVGVGWETSTHARTHTANEKLLFITGSHDSRTHARYITHIRQQIGTAPCSLLCLCFLLPLPPLSSPPPPSPLFSGSGQQPRSKLTGGSTKPSTKSSANSTLCRMICGMIYGQQSIMSIILAKAKYIAKACCLKLGIQKSRFSIQNHTITRFWCNLFIFTLGSPNAKNCLSPARLPNRCIFD